MPAQVSLYLLLMSERYGHEVDLGLLWNLQKPVMQVEWGPQGEACHHGGALWRKWPVGQGQLHKSGL